MAGVLFDYFQGYLRIGFSRAWHGDIYMDLSFHGDAVAATPCDDHFEKGEPEISVQPDVAVRTWISSTFCAFPSLLSWLEATTVGVEECAFTWDGEGPDGELRWFGSRDVGRLQVLWSQDDTNHSVRLSKTQMVRAFYESFRGFVESDRYDPLQYEPLKVGECCALVLEDGDLDALAAELAMRDRQAAWRLLDEILDLAYNHAAGYPRRASLAAFAKQADGHPERAAGDTSRNERWFPAQWDGWCPSQRRQDVVDHLYSCRAGMGFGSRLRELRSPMVEAWLARGAGMKASGDA